MQIVTTLGKPLLGEMHVSQKEEEREKNANNSAGVDGGLLKKNYLTQNKSPQGVTPNIFVIICYRRR